MHDQASRNGNPRIRGVGRLTKNGPIIKPMNGRAASHRIGLPSVGLGNLAGRDSDDREPIPGPPINARALKIVLAQNRPRVDPECRGAEPGPSISRRIGREIGRALSFAADPTGIVVALRETSMRDGLRSRRSAMISSIGRDRRDHDSMGGHGPSGLHAADRIPER